MSGAEWIAAKRQTGAKQILAWCKLWDVVIEDGAAFVDWRDGQRARVGWIDDASNLAAWVIEHFASVPMISSRGDTIVFVDRLIENEYKALIAERALVGFGKQTGSRERVE